MSTERQDEELSKSIKKLQGENYASWEFQVRQTLKAKGLWQTIRPGNPPADDATDAVKEAWQTKCVRASTTISLLCDPNIQGDIRTKEAELAEDSDGNEDQDGEERDYDMTPKALWAFLKEEYASASIHAQIRINKQLTHTLNNPKSSMRDHIAEVGELYMQLAETGKPVKEEYRCAELLGSLPDAFQYWVAAQSEAKKWGVLRLKILEEERRLKDREDRAARNKTETAFAVGAGSGPGPSSYSMGQGRGGYGHGYQGYRGRGHSFGRGRGRGGFGFGTFPGNCNICRKPGHKAMECPHHGAFTKFQDSIGEETPRERTHEHVAAVRDTSGPPQREALGDFEFELCSAVGAAPTASNTFILDTASSRHITTDRSKLQGYRPAAPGTGIECANGSKMAVEGYGTMEVVTSEGATVKLEDVAHCPTAIGNLVGGKRLTRAGCEITFTDSAARVVKIGTGKLIMVAEVRGGNWTVELMPLREVVALVKAEAKIDPVAVKIHKGWAHLNMDTLRAAAAAGLIPGLTKVLGDIGFCDACAQGKMHHTPHERVLHEDRAKRALELIHADIFGPTRMKDALALGGYRFGLVIVDDHTRYVWIIPLRFKSDAIMAFKTFHLAMSTQYPNLPISRVRTDNALEFKASELHRFWEEKGVKHELAPRYSPQSNGVAERNVRTITEMTRTMLIGANLPAFFWPAAAGYAAHIKNRVTAAGLQDGKTPFEQLNGKKPSPQVFKPFGCTAWAMKPSKEREGKFDAKSVPCVYLGPAFKGASKLWDPVRNKELIDHSVVFDEDNSASTLLQEHQRAAEGNVPEFSFLDDEGDQRPQQQPETQPRIEKLPPLQQAMQNILRSGVVPAEVLPSVRTIASGGQISREALAVVARRLAAQSRKTAAADSGRDGENGTAGEQQTRSARPQRQMSSVEQQQESSVAERQREEGDRGRSEQSGRRSGRLAGEEPVYGPLGAETSRKRKEPGDPEGGCFMVLDPEEMALGDPRTVREAMERPDKEQWLEAMHKEVKSHITRGTWRVVKAYGKANLISSKWVLRLKKNADGSIQKYKARLVARGFTQVEGVDFDETFAPTSRLQNMRLLCAMAAALGLDIHQIDYETAYLNAALKNEIYMLPPDGMDLLGQNLLPDDALELLLALYGLKQSGHEWHRVLKEALSTIGFCPSKIDPTMFVREGDRPAILLVYVDDILVLAPPGGAIQSVKKELLALFKGTDLGPAHHCLGIRIVRNEDEGTITLDQERYAEEVLARFGMSSCAPVKTPLCSKKCLRKAVDGEVRCDIRIYQAIIGCLAYLAQGTRPDLAFAVSTLGKFNSDPTEDHMIAAKRALRYIRGTSGAKLTFGGDKGKDGIEVEGYVDADWAADRDDRRSMSGFVFTMAGGAVSWGSRKQGAVALSTAEAEYVAAGVAGREALLLSGALAAAGKDMGTITVHCDNQAAIQLVKNPGSHHDRSKHIDIVHHWIRDKSQEGAFAFQYIPTDLNPADAFTKALGQIKHRQHAQAIGVALALGAWIPGSEGAANDIQ
ncbi:hypothetical protein CF319_g1123 [Tilletia indica]|nr:hypothetical protein CF319_g1123 [Tilletia indica]